MILIWLSPAGEMWKLVFLSDTLLVFILFSTTSPSRFHRGITRPFFSKERISDFDVFDRHAEEALKQAKGRLAEGYPIDFQV